MRLPFVVTALATTLIPIAYAQSFQWSSGSGGNGHFYQAVVVPAGIGWKDARVAAATMGGYLATITSSAENQFVFGLIDSPAFWYSGSTEHNYGPWIGASQDSSAGEPAGGWMWLHGDGLVADTFSAWWPGEPNDAHYVTAPDGEDFAHFGRPGSPLLRDATWNDLADVPTFYPGDGILVRSFVVEYDVSPVPEPETYALLAAVSLGAFAIARRAVRSTPSLLKPA